MKYYQEQLALGSTAQVCIVSDGNKDYINKLYRDIWLKIFSFEKRFSRFLPSSELSMLNRNAGYNFPASSDLIMLLNKAKRLSIDTNGIYNPFILPALQAAGYTGSLVKGYEKDPVDNYSSRSVVDIRMLEIGDNWVKLPYGSAVDLGGCGKGYLVDLLSAFLKDKVSGYWISVGGDLAVAGHDENGSNWDIKIESSSSAFIRLSAKDKLAVATSGTAVRSNKKNQKNWHHLIDPRTLKPAITDVLIASVCHRSCMAADVYASCAVILGTKSGLKFLKSRGISDALLQTASERITTGHLISIDDKKTIEYNNA